MTRASFFATLLPNARIPLNKRICKREPSFQVGSLSCIRSIQYSRYISPISFQIFFFFQRPLTRGEEIPQSALFVRVFKHVSSAQTILRSSFAASAFRDAFFVYYFRIIFGYFSQKKVLLLRFPFLCTYPIPLGLKTKEEPKMNQGTPKELPTTKKCFLLRLATSKKSLLR